MYVLLESLHLLVKEAVSDSTARVVVVLLCLASGSCTRVFPLIGGESSSANRWIIVVILRFVESSSLELACVAHLLDLWLIDEGVLVRSDSNVERLSHTGDRVCVD